MRRTFLMATAVLLISEVAFAGDAKLRTNLSDVLWCDGIYTRPVDLPIIGVRPYRWRNTQETYGVSKGDPGLLVEFAVPEHVSQRGQVTIWLAGAYVANWQIVRIHADDAWDLIERQYAGEKTPIATRCCPLRTYKGESPPGYVEWHCLDDGALGEASLGSIVVLLHWDGHGVSPEEMAEKVKGDGVLAAWGVEDINESDAIAADEPPPPPEPEPRPAKEESQAWSKVGFVVMCLLICFAIVFGCTWGSKP